METGVEAGMDPSAAGADGLAAPGSCFAAGRLPDRPWISVARMARIQAEPRTAMPAGAAFGAFFFLGFLGGIGADTTRQADALTFG